MFELLKEEGRARRGRFKTVHGVIETPVFMNVGTLAAIKGGVSAFDLAEIGCQVELSNTYHLHLRPGEDVIYRLGGLGRFMGWSGPTLTDSGGFQVFSLARLRKIREEGVYFNSHADGRAIFMGPEESMKIQSRLGSTIAMAFDICPPSKAPRREVERAQETTFRWLLRCKEKMKELNSRADTLNPEQLLFGINQGGTLIDLRIENMKKTAELDLPGYAIGGLAVGETHSEMYNVIESVVPHMPKDRPRYLMGVGTPENILEAVERGVDFFDCVIASRNARHAYVFTGGGALRLKNEKYKYDDGPIEKGCACPTCQRHSRAYIRHLFKAGEMLAARLCVLHNLYFYNNMMAEIRAALDEGRFAAFKRDMLSELAKGE